IFLTQKRQGYRILDVSDPSVPVQIAQFSFSDDARKLLVQDDLLFCIDEGNRINIVNISDVNHPVPVSEITLPFMTVFDLYYENRILYVIEGTIRGVRMYDLRIPATPVFLNDFNYPSCRSFVKNGDYGYLAASWYLLVLEMSNPSNPQLITTINTHGSDIEEMAIEDDFLFLTKYRGGLEVYSLANPEAPVLTGYHRAFWSTGLEINAPYAYVADGASMRIFDCSEALVANDVEGESPTPVSFTIENLYPNPFNSTLTIHLSLPTSSSVTISLINSLGQEMSAVERSWSAGEHLFTLNADIFPSGIYFVRVDAVNETRIQKAILLR
ncbi:T9SS type A sorting domain-containing protein, partial [bacterium]|nr:T9SS type A sorting domain-containing protein [bacterium]